MGEGDGEKGGGGNRTKHFILLDQYLYLNYESDLSFSFGLSHQFILFVHVDNIEDEIKN